MKFDKELADFLDSIIEEKAKALFDLYIQQSRILKGWNATVVTNNGDGTVDVKLAGDNIVITKKNKSGVTLAVGDEVELHSMGSLSNAYVAICKTKWNDY